jgi:hypothetical protein
MQRIKEISMRVALKIAKKLRARNMTMEVTPDGCTAHIVEAEGYYRVTSPHGSGPRSFAACVSVDWLSRIADIDQARFEVSGEKVMARVGRTKYESTTVGEPYTRDDVLPETMAVVDVGAVKAVAKAACQDSGRPHIYGVYIGEYIEATDGHRLLRVHFGEPNPPNVLVPLHICSMLAGVECRVAGVGLGVAVSYGDGSCDVECLSQLAAVNKFPPTAKVVDTAPYTHTIVGAEWRAALAAHSGVISISCADGITTISEDLPTGNISTEIDCDWPEEITLQAAYLRDALDLLAAADGEVHARIDRTKLQLHASGSLAVIMGMKI